MCWGVVSKVPRATRPQDTSGGGKKVIRWRNGESSLGNFLIILRGLDLVTVCDMSVDSGNSLRGDEEE
jgi:hypothetical protein